MDRTAIKDLIYGGLQEILKDSKNYRYSGLGPNYSHLTEHGEKILIEFVNIFGHEIRKAEEEDLDIRAKQQVLDGLKGSI